MDDGTLGGDVDCLVNDYLTIVNDYFTIVQEGKEIGLVVNPQKCEIITNDLDIVQKFYSLAPEMVHTSPSVATLLARQLVLTKVLLTFFVHGKLEDLKRMTENLKQLNAHDALFLLKNCFSIPKLTYTLRCAPCYNQEILSEYDDVIRSTLQLILKISLSEDAWCQASLPVSNGAIGVRSACQVALPAFLSSVEASHQLIQDLLPVRLRQISGRNNPDHRNKRSRMGIDQSDGA